MKVSANKAKNKKIYINQITCDYELSYFNQSNFRIICS